MSKDADSPIVTRGPLLTIEYAVRTDGSMPAKEFVEGLDEADQLKLIALFCRMAEKGSISNQLQFKKIRGSIFEFKKQQMRVFCFRHGSRWFLTNGYKKKAQKLRMSEIDRAERIMQEHQAQGN